MDVCVVDYGGGNVRSLCNALEFIGAKYIVTDDVSIIRNSKKIMFPGVGSFGSVMKKLCEKGLDSAIVDAIGCGASFFGICVGMQVLFSRSDESPGVSGLCVIEGDVVKFRSGKIPQIGWNMVECIDKNVFFNGYAYFVNSYYVVPRDENIVASVTEYNGCVFSSGVIKGKVYATQFHPEKSGRTGLEMIRRWLYDS